MPRYLSFPFLLLFYFLCHVLFCLVLRSPPLMLCVYLQTFEAALFQEEEVLMFVEIDSTSAWR